MQCRAGDVPCRLVATMLSSSEPTSPRFTPELLATFVIVLAYIVWILSLPALPTQDGPIHLYYTHVLRALFSHADTTLCALLHDQASASAVLVLLLCAAWSLTLCVASPRRSADRMCVCRVVRVRLSLSLSCARCGRRFHDAALHASSAQLAAWYGLRQLLPVAVVRLLGAGTLASLGRAHGYKARESGSCCWPS